MRKLIIFAALIGATPLAFGQGWVGFTSVWGGDHSAELFGQIYTNNASTNGTFYGGGGGPPIGYNGAFNTPTNGASWYIELLVAPTSQTTIDASLSGWTPVFTGTNALTYDWRIFPMGLADIGGVEGTAPGAAAEGGVPVAGTTTNDVRNFAVVGWSANLGSDWNSVFACRPTTLVSGPGDGTNALVGSAPWTNTTAPPPPGWTRADLTSLLGPGAAVKPGGFYGISQVMTNIPLAPSNGPYADVFYPTTGPYYSGVPVLYLNYYASCSSGPVFNSQPTNQVVPIGQTATLAVTAAGCGSLVYQWTMNGTNLPGATTNTYVIANAQPANAGDYAVIVVNSFGSVTSAVAMVEIGQPITLFNTGLDPSGNPLPGGSADPHWSLSGAVTGTPKVINPASLWYQWSPDTTNSSWLGVNSGPSQPTTFPYYFNQSFTITGDPTAAILGGTWWGDDNTTLMLNGNAITNIGNNFTGVPWFVTGQSGLLKSGTNTLTVEMNHGDGNADGVRVEVTGFVTELIPCTQPPVITSEPTNQVAAAGQNVVLSVAAPGALPCTQGYQWFFDGSPVSTGTNSVYTIANAQTSDAGSYFAIVSNASGAATSTVAVVTVLMSPQITQDPSNTVVAAGGALSLSLAVVGTPPLSYQWYRSAGAISGATSTNYVINPAQTNNTDSYFAIVTNVYGSATSHVANVIVYTPINITQQPQNQVVPAGGTAMFNVQASGFPAPSYQWIFRGTNWGGKTSNPLIISNVNLSNLGTYAVLVSNVGSSQMSSNATLSMSPSITMSYTGATGIWGRSAVLSVGAIGSGLTYQWYENGMAIASATNSSYTFSTVQLTNGGNYSVVVSSPYGSVTNSAQFKVIAASMDVGTCASIDIGGVVGSNYVIQGSYYAGGMFGTTNTWITLTNLTLVQTPELWVDTSANAFRAGTRYYQVLPAPASTNQAKVACINIGGVAGYSYIIQRTDDMLNTNAWMTLTNLVLQQHQQVWADTSTNAPTAGVRCYRILPGQ